MEKRIIEQLIKKIRRVPIETENIYLFLSISNKKDRAKVQNTRTMTLTDAANWLEEKLTNQKIEECFIRVDVVTHANEYSYQELRKRLSLVPRNNYFRQGIAFDRKFKHAFLAEELMGSALLKPSLEHKVGFNSPNLQLNEKNITTYMMRKYGESLTKKISQKKFYAFKTQGFYFERNEWLELSTFPQQEGLRELDARMLPNRVDQSIRYGEQFLNAQLKKDGQFIYGYYPTYDYELSGYNSVRHFSSIYALLEAQEYLGLDDEVKQTEKGIQWGLTNLTLLKENALYIKEETKRGISLKLGAQALAILAIAKFQTITGNKKYEAVINQLILGMERHFISSEGDTTHILNKELETKKKFNIIYYDGEAVFSILRAYAITKNDRHLALAKKLFDRFVEKKYEKYHDHWLSYATNELLLYIEDKKYFEFGLKNAFENLRFIEHRDTAYPTMLELLMAAIKMTDRLQQTSLIKEKALTDYVSKEDFWALKQVAVKRVENELTKGVMYPELAMFMKRPSKIVNGFYTRHDKFRMRIDDQEHFLSGLVNYYDYFYREVDKE
ncbi:hypothetical protein [Enterococcus sp. AZ007]|uniref:hypothetical protein n=1 Tax=Enterococcus sp. AZ007 TaxID=2774839 RepID=UPI003F28BF5A